jgi:hypothetical protein
MTSARSSRFQELLAELKGASPEFAAMWAQRDIEDAGQIRRELDHPVLGLLVVESTAMNVAARPDLTIVLHRCTPWRGERGRAPYARSMTDSNALDPEDRKIVTLARSARARNDVPEGAAVRDETGRTYVAGTVALDSLKLSALRTAVAMAVASGATSLEAAAVVTSADSASAEDLAAVRDLGGAGTPVLVAAPDGTVRTTVQAG